MTDSLDNRLSGIVAQTVPPSSYAGDPRNPYHELRRFLLHRGIDTRVYTYGSIHLPKALESKSKPVIEDYIGVVDNSFFFDLHKTISTDSGNQVTAVALKARVFFDDCQTSQRFHAQLVLNHHGDANLELNAFYGALMDTLQTDGGWVDPTGESPNRIKYFEKTYENDSGFKAFVVKQMLPLLERYNVYNNIPSGSQPCQ